ncbi:MAG: hypothetical protein CL607_04930 [Anaerolineaceae bacterium]|nr:hypothetical protein [Anaerolineaceae bacterium]
MSNAMQKSAMHKHESARWCPNCQIGKQTAKTVTLTARVNDTLLQVPDVSLYTCDICGYEEMDADVSEMIDELSHLDENSGEEKTANGGEHATHQSPAVFNQKDIHLK